MSVLSEDLLGADDPATKKNKLSARHGIKMKVETGARNAISSCKSCYMGVECQYEILRNLKERLVDDGGKADNF